MNADTRTRLKQVFTDHTALMQAAALTRTSRGREAENLVETFRAQFEAHAATVIVPVFEEVSGLVRENGHGCSVASATHGTFFSSAGEDPGVIFMFYPDVVREEDYVLRPLSSYVAVFADLSGQQAQLYAKSVRPGGFTAGQLPDVLSLSEITAERLVATCIRVIKDTLHRMEA